MKPLRFFFLLAFALPIICFGQDDYVQDTAIENEDSYYLPPPPEDGVEPATTVNEFPFDQIDGPPAVEVKTLPPQAVDKLKNDDDYWYADYVPQKKKPKETTPPKAINLGWLRPLFWIVLIGGLIAGIIWFLANNDVRLFARPSKKIAVEDEEEELTDDIFAINFEREIRKAEDAGNYRLAVRLWYLRTLRELADRSLIDYNYGKTNSDYVSALFGGNYYRPFFGLTRTFDYTWYGQFPLSAETYGQVAADFIAFKKGLGA